MFNSPGDAVRQASVSASLPQSQPTNLTHFLRFWGLAVRRYEAVSAPAVLGKAAAVSAPDWRLELAWRRASAPLQPFDESWISRPWMSSSAQVRAFGIVPRSSRQSRRSGRKKEPVKPRGPTQPAEVRDLLYFLLLRPAPATETSPDSEELTAKVRRSRLSRVFLDLTNLGLAGCGQTLSSLPRKKASSPNRPTASPALNYHAERAKPPGRSRELAFGR